MRLMTSLRRLLFLLLLLSFPGLLTANLMYPWSYQEMFDKAGIVVIGKPLSTIDTKERSKVPGIGDVISLIGIDTEFETRLILKGDKNLKKFVLHHYRLAEPNEPIINGPELITFDIGRPKTFLLFLSKESDGRYAPVSGQVDPGAFSVIELNSSAQ